MAAADLPLHIVTSLPAALVSCSAGTSPEAFVLLAAVLFVVVVGSVAWVGAAAMAAGRCAGG